MSAPAATLKLDYDLGAAREFLRCLDPDAKYFTFQTFDDVKFADGRKRGDKSLARVIHGTIEEHFETLRTLNDHGAGVFVCVTATDGKGRKKENIIRVREIWHEGDGPDSDRVLPALVPHLIVETSPGNKHRHIFVDNLTSAEFAGVMCTMVEKFGSDKNAADLSRVLRLPGFYHCKDPQRRHPVKIIAGSWWPGGFDDGKRYSSTEILSAIPPTYPEAPKPKQVEPRPPKPPRPKPAPGVEDDEAPDIERIKDALRFIPADERRLWVDIGMALHHAFNDYRGFEIWDEWSQTCQEKYEYDDLERVWNSFRDDAEEPITLGSLFHEARKRGWPGDVGAKTRHFEEHEPAPEGEQPGAETKSPRLTRRMSEVEEKPVNWFWYPYIPAGQGSLLAGLGAVGKGLIASSLAAAVTTGSPLPGSNERAEPGDVFWWEAEDSAEHTLKARFRAAGADMQRIHEIRPKNFALLNLKDYIRRENIKLIIASPLVAFLKGLDDLNSELKMRAALDVIQDAIDGTDCAILGLAHLNKKDDLRTIERVLGSVALVNFMRSVLFAAKENQETGQGRLVHVKHNLSRKGRDLLYTPVSSNERAQDVKAVWSVPEANVDADSMYDRNKKKSDKPTAGSWLVEYLQANGGNWREKVIGAAADDGFKAEAIDKAHERDRRCHSRQAGFPAKAWWWLGPP